METYQQAGPLVGTVLDGRYRVDTMIATGGTSSVYRGLDLRLDRPVALKVMAPPMRPLECRNVWVTVTATGVPGLVVDGSGEVATATDMPRARLCT